MARDFKSFIVDPNLLDPDIDLTDLATTTDTRKELLFNAPDYTGIQVDPTQKDYLGDLYALYSGQLPSRPATPSAPPPATGGGGSGGEGQVATPPTGGSGGGGVNTPEQQRLIDEGIGLQISPGSPVFAPGEIPVTQKEIDDFNKIPVNTDYRNQQLVNQGIGIRVGDDGPVFAPGEAPVTQADIDSFNNEQQSTLQNILGKAGQTVEGALTELGKIPGAIVDFTNKTVDVFGNKLDVGKTLAGAVLNKIAGGPVSLLLSALPEPDPRQRKLNEFYSTGEGAKYMDPNSPNYIPGMEDYHTVSGGFLNTITGGKYGTPTNYGLQGSYQKRIDTVENTLQDKYGLTDKDIADIKAGTFDPEKMNVQTDLVQRLVDLGDAKKAEADMLGLTAAEEKRLQELDFKDYFAGNKDQDSVDRFDTTAPSDLDFENQYEDEDRFTGDTTKPDPADAIFGPGAQFLDYDEQVSPGTIRSGIENDDQPDTIRSPFEDAIFGPGAQFLDYDEQVSPGTIRSGIENDDQPDTITGVTRPGTGTVLGKEGIEKFDDYLDDIDLDDLTSSSNSFIDTLSKAPELVTGFPEHLQDNDKIKQLGLAPDDYNIISAMNAADNMKAGATSLAGPGLLYTIGDTIVDPNQSIIDGVGDYGRYMKGVTIQNNPELAKTLFGEDYVNDMLNKYDLAMEKIGKPGYKPGPDPSKYAGSKERDDGDFDDQPGSSDDLIGPGGRMDILDIGGEDDPDNEGMTREEMDAEAAQKAAEARELDRQQRQKAADDAARERAAEKQRAAEAKAKAEREMQQKIRDAENQERQRVEAAEKAAAEKAAKEREMQQKIRDAENQERERQAAAQRAAEAKAKAEREAQQRIRDAENQERERQEAAQKAAEKAAKEKRDMQQKIRDAENQERERQEAQDKATREKDLGSGPPGIGGGGNGDGGGCFLKGTLVTMADGSTKPVEQVDLKDNVAEGGKVFATGKFLVENLHDYKGIKVSGSHMVNEDNKWVRVENSKHGKPLGDDEHTVYVFGSENRKILINGILFTDYFEVKEQKKFLEDEKKFFKNWKQFSNEHNESNVNILNAS